MLNKVATAAARLFRGPFQKCTVLLAAIERHANYAQTKMKARHAHESHPLRKLIEFTACPHSGHRFP